MSNLVPTAEEFLPFVRQANDDYPRFDRSVIPNIASFAGVSMVKARAAYREASPEIFRGVLQEYAGDPLSALETVVERAKFLRRCARDLQTLAPGQRGVRFFPALEINFCPDCPPSRAGKKLIVPAEILERHPLLDCAAPVCKGTTYVVTGSRIKKEKLKLQQLPSAR